MLESDRELEQLMIHLLVIVDEISYMSDSDMQDRTRDGLVTVYNILTILIYRVTDNYSLGSEGM